MNTFGDIFKITIYGGSHEEEIGLLIEGIPSGLYLDKDLIISDLKKRCPSNFFETKRLEEDDVIVKSGVFNNYTTGGILVVAIKNKNTDSSRYEEFYYHPRPGHADYSQLQKSKYQNINGGGICSGRMTALLVIAGSISKLIYDFNVSASVKEVMGIKDQKEIDDLLVNLKEEGDSCGGIVEVSCDLFSGLGDPFFDSLESRIAHLLFSVPGVKGVSFGLGFSGTKLKGSMFNDSIIDQTGRTLTNNNGGISGGISNGNKLICNVAIRPAASIYKEQQCYNFKTNKVEPLFIKGRHDVTFIYRSLIVFEACLNIVLVDCYLRNKLFFKNN